MLYATLAQFNPRYGLPLIADVRCVKNMADFNIKKRAYADIEARFTCPHMEREVRHRINRDDRPVYVSQCIKCGHTSYPMKEAEAKRSGKPIPEYDYELQNRWRGAKSLAYDATRKAIKPQLKAEYEAYLKTEEWNSLRVKVFENCKGVCEVCENSPAEQVHHLTYERIGNEELDDLMGVCRPCHELIHGYKCT